MIPEACVNHADADADKIASSGGVDPGPDDDQRLVAIGLAMVESVDMKRWYDDENDNYYHDDFDVGNGCKVGWCFKYDDENDDEINDENGEENDDENGEENDDMRMMMILMMRWTMRMRIWSVGSSGVGPCPGRC